MAMSKRDWGSALAERASDLQTALAFATRLPLASAAPPIMLLRALRVMSLAGAIIGAAAALIYVLASEIGLQPPLAGAAALAFQAWLTRGLHEDGLADFADGIGGGSSRERKLAIMRDSRIGTFGVLALLFVILGKVLALGAAGAVSGQLAAGALITAGALSRLAPVLLLHRLPPARLDGRSYEVGCPDKETVTEASVYALVAAVLVAMAVRGAGTLLAALLASAVAYFAVESLSRRHLGGQTGDVAGASQQAVELAVLMAFAAIPPS
jgi:adenosylcobinamide-GDP ribazoletransferase